MAEPRSKTAAATASTSPVVEQHVPSARDSSLATTQAHIPSGPAADASQADPHAARFVAVLDEYLRSLKRGESPDREALLAAHPDLAEQLADCFAGLEFIHSVSHPSSAQPARVLGDFRIIREIGHGGMGAVYEAEQLSLGRRVALKVLRFSGVSDPEAIERFQREAETVARLHHTNIVPIFAVGSEQGVNYYAMQFIEGQSLDQVLRERVERGEPLGFETLAEWGLQAAEALAHAHAREVIHRDVKPSNLLIDAEEGRIWLTDFGLAKRLDVVSLSMTGALLGTPRYMSPEQAATTHSALDHRTDIYSLGATLYELATGQPLFRGDSPHKLINQILTVDPEPPRRHRPDLPRDLETILMKCLSKEAGQRYETARQLVDDLRAFLDGRPIAARRANLVERTARWVKRQKRSVALTAGAVAATLLVVVIGVAGTYAWHRSRLAFVMLKSDHSLLVAELLEDGEHVIPPVTVPTQNRLEIPAGNYQLHLTSNERLSQAYDVRLRAGEFFEHKLNLDDQLIWSDLQLERSYALARFEQRSDAASRGTPAADAQGTDRDVRAIGSRVDVVLLTDEGLRCLWGHNSQTRWELKLKEPTHPLLQQQPQLAWPWDQFFTSSYSGGFGMFDDRPMLVSQADAAPSVFMDFNADGASDLILASRNQAGLVAVNGQDGSPLWVVMRDTAESAPSAQGVRNRQRLGGVLYPPQLVADQDNDSVDDVLVSYLTLQDESAPARRWVELISGSTGQTHWQFELPGEYFELPQSEQIPYELRWFYGRGGGYSNSGGGFSLESSYMVRSYGDLERSGSHHYLPTRPVVVTHGDSDVTDGSPATTAVAMVAGRHLVQLNLQTGQPLVAKQDLSASIALKTRPVVQPLAADCDGDGETDLLLLEPAAEKLPTTSGRLASQVSLVAWSLAKQKVMWQRQVTASVPRQREMSVPLPAWPLAVDLDGDGAAEILTPSASSEGVKSWGEPPWGKLTVLDGRTGDSRWQRQLFTMDQRLEHFVPGPDVDDDAVREIFVATLWGTAGAESRKSLFVDCLSGADGHSIWRTEQALVGLESSNASLNVAGLHWSSTAANGGPEIVISLRRTDGETVDRSYLVAANTGRLTHTAMGVSEIESGDLDADGINDLLLFHRRSTSEWTRGGSLQAVRGAGDEAWQQIPSAPLTAVGDLNGDGIRDLVTRQTRGPLEAVSGASGAQLWQTTYSTVANVAMETTAARQHEGGAALPSPEHDLDDDGTPDLLLVSQPGHSSEPRPLVWALSGRSGRKLWQSAAAGYLVAGVNWLDCRDLDGDGQPEIVMAAAFDHDLPQRQSFSKDEARLWLMILAGASGEIQWAEPLTAENSPSVGNSYRFDDVSLEACYADLDEDGVLDIVLPGQGSPTSRALEMRAISGRDGHSLWRFPLPVDSGTRDSLANVPPAAIADVSGDGRPEVVVTSLATSPPGDGSAGVRDYVQLDLLDGASGKPHWHWQTAADRWGNQIGNHRNRLESRLRAVLIRRPTGGHWIGLRLWNRNQEVHVIDEHGTLVSQLSRSGSFDQERNRLWALDADGDGGDELLLLAQSELALLRPDQLDAPQWRLPAAEGSKLNQVLGVIAGGDREEPLRTGTDGSCAPTIVVQGGVDDYSVRGIDVASGRILWICVAPAPRPVAADHQPPDLLNVPSQSVPPHAFFQFQSKAVVRRGVVLEPRLRQESSQERQGDDLQGSPTNFVSTASGAGGVSAFAWNDFAQRNQTPVVLTEDPRLLRPLPWKPAEYQVREMPRFASWVAFYGLTLAALPLLCVWSATRRRTWDLRLMLWWMTAAALAMLGVMIDGPDRDFRTLSGKLLVAYFAAGPVLFTLLVFSRRMWQGHWSNIFRWLMSGLVTTACFMALSIGTTAWRAADSLQPGERFVWDGWYWMALPVFYALTWAVVLAVIGQWLVRQVWRRSSDSGKDQTIKLAG